MSGYEEVSVLSSEPVSPQGNCNTGLECLEDCPHVSSRELVLGGKVFTFRCLPRGSCQGGAACALISTDRLAMPLTPGVRVAVFLRAPWRHHRGHALHHRDDGIPIWKVQKVK